MPGPVPVYVPLNCQTACDDRLKAGPLREIGQPPGFGGDGWGPGLPVPEWLEPFLVPFLLSKGPVSEFLRAPKTPAPDRPGAAVSSLLVDIAISLVSLVSH